jgi:SNF2 family DNA or RNA helicase
VDIKKAYDQLKSIRTSTTLSLKPTRMLREEITGLDGSKIPFKLRYYQCQGIFHLLVMKRMVLGDGTGLGKTCQTIGALCYLYPTEPDNKTIILCPKSAIRQWGSEVERFTNGIKVLIPKGKVEQREETYREFLAAPTGPDDPKVVMVMNYHTLVRDWQHGFKPVPLDSRGKPIPGAKPVLGLLESILVQVPSLVTVMDEVTACKNGQTKTWQVCKALSDISHRCYGLTATLLKNKLEEGFYIMKVIQPAVFTSKAQFIKDYCHTQMQRVKGSRRQIPIIVGYKNLETFRQTIDPYFYGRPKHAVATELPKLTTREIVCELSPAEDRKYGEALEGILEMGDGEVKDYEETKVLTSLIYCQQIADSLALLKFKEGDVIHENHIEGVNLEFKEMSAKEQALLDLLTEEFEGEKVIVYTKFESHVGRLQKLLEKAGIKSVRVTGKENEAKRKISQDAFQDPNSDTQVILITDAGSEAINLQAAVALVFMNAPYSYGGYAQLLGRPIRIGSPHPNVYAIHLVARRPRKGKEQKTIDDHVLKLLQKKQDFIEKIIGEAAVGALTFTKDSAVKDLFQQVLSGARGKEE